jgi:hypothetical protein
VHGDGIGVDGALALMALRSSMSSSQPGSVCFCSTGRGRP